MAKKKPSRYERVKRILDRAAEGSCADYQGHGRFWNLPLADFLEVEVYGVRMIAPPSGGGGPELTPGDRAALAGGSCCGSAKDDEGDDESCCGPPPPRRDPGRGARSGLVKGLRGQYPFDGSQFPRLMWDGKTVSLSDIQLIEEWIDDGCPETDERPHVEVSESSRKARAMGDEEHPQSERPVNDLNHELRCPKVRKNVTCLTDEELRRLKNAILHLRSFDAWALDERSYDYWARIHGSNCQHGWEEFLPWHRAYLYFFEQQLQDFDHCVTLPYWQWSQFYDENKRVNIKPKTGIDEGVIPRQYHCWVDDGTLKWLDGKIPERDLRKLRKIKIGADGEPTFNSGSRLLEKAGIDYNADREVGRTIEAALQETNALWHRRRWPGGNTSVLFQNYPSPADIQRILQINNFYQFNSGPADNHFFGALERIHNLLHNWSGGINPYFEKGKDEPNSLTEPLNGDMVSLVRTAYDAIFWAHHSNVDRLWAEWQQLHPGQDPDNPTAPLPPWPFNVEQTLSVSRLGYEYVKCVHHYPTDAGSGIERFKSAPAGTPEHVVDDHSRAEIRLHDVYYKQKCGVIRVFLNAPDADASTPTAGNDRYVDEYHIFASPCAGGPGHCEPPPRDGRKFDHRHRHRKTPSNVRFDATDAVARLKAKGERDFRVNLVVIDLEGQPASDVLSLEGVSLRFFE